MRKVFHVKGEKFDQISVFPDHIECRNGILSVLLFPEDMGCIDYLNDKVCQDKECRYHVNYPDIDNCVLNAHKKLTLEEIGGLLGFSREMVRLEEEKALLNSRRALKKMNKHLVWDASDFINTYPEWHIKEKRIGR